MMSVRERVSRFLVRLVVVVDVVDVRVVVVLVVDLRWVAESGGPSLSCGERRSVVELRRAEVRRCCGWLVTTCCALRPLGGC